MHGVSKLSVYVEPTAWFDQMTRAFLTDGERRAIEGDEEMDDNTRSSHISRVKRKTERLRDDAEMLRTHHPELYQMVYEAVCREDIEERLESVEGELDQLRDVLQEQGIETSATELESDSEG